MADTSVIAQQGAKDVALLTKTQVASCVMHLYDYSKLPTPTPLTPLSAFLAAECTFDGYTPATIATWENPILAGNGYIIYAPTQTFPWTFSSGVGNMVGGYFIVLSGGDLKMFTSFDPAESCAGPDQAIVRTPSILFPWG